MGEEIVLNDIDLISAIVQKQTDNIRQFIDSCKDSIKHYMRSYDYDGLVSLFDILKLKSLSASKRVEKKDAQSYYIGMLAGFVEILNEYILEKNKTNLVEKTFPENQINEIPHIQEIITSVASSPGIRHIQLADKIGLDKASLSRTMNKLVDCGIITFSRPGKFKYYYLTDTGWAFYIKNKNQLDSHENIDALCQKIISIANSSDDPIRIFMLVVQKIFEQNYSQASDNRIKSKVLANEAISYLFNRSEPIDLKMRNSNISYEIKGAMVFNTLLVLNDTVENSNNFNWERKEA